MEPGIIQMVIMNNELYLKTISSQLELEYARNYSNYE